MSKKVLVIGGLGFIGYHISNILSHNDLEVTVAHRSNSSKYNSDYTLIHLDLNSVPDDQLADILKEFSFIIFCGGADDRNIPKGDAASFYYKENVSPCLRLAKATANSNVEKLIILGSYFSHFERTKPQWKLRTHHPYIKSRYLQQTETSMAAGSHVQVSTIEIPYVFGSAPGKIPLWKPLIKYIDKMPFVFYTKGGTNIMSVEQVAKATLGILETRKYKPHWTIGSENVSWTKLIQMIAAALGKKRKVILIPNFIVKFIALLTKFYFKIANKESGLDPFRFVDVQTSNTFLDVSETMEDLNYDKTDLQQSINDTVEACGYSEKD